MTLLHDAIMIGFGMGVGIFCNEAVSDQNWRRAADRTYFAMAAMALLVFVHR